MQESKSCALPFGDTSLFMALQPCFVFFASFFTLAKFFVLNSPIFIVQRYPSNIKNEKREIVTRTTSPFSALHSTRRHQAFFCVPLRLDICRNRMEGFFLQQILQEVLKRLIASIRQVLSSWSCTPISRNISASSFLVKKLPMPLFFSAAWASGTLRTEERNLPCLELLQAPAQCRSSAEQPELQVSPAASQQAYSAAQAHFQQQAVLQYAVQCQA